MMRHAITAVAVIGFALTTLLVGCETFGGNSTDNGFQTDCTKSTAVSNAQGKGHGEACTTGTECLYGFCKFAALQLINDGTQGICTKDCSCGAGSQCDADNALTGKSYTCIHGSAPPKHKECAVTCGDDADCSALNPALPFCLGPFGYDKVFSTAVRVCAAKKP